MPRTDKTIETALATVRDLAGFMDGYLGKRDRALANVQDIEASLATLPKGRKRPLTVLRQFFRFARVQKTVLIDPTRGLSVRQPGSPDSPFC
jgi:site-specific recombinase XerD